MDGSHRRHSSSPVFADFAGAQGCDNELSRSESESESEMDSSSTVVNSNARLHQIGDSAKECVTAWTNEKHNLYLDHLESSFIEQLHRSSSILAWRSEHVPNGSYSSQKLHAETQHTSEQVKILQDGHLENTNLKRCQHLLNHEAGSLFVPENPLRFAGRRFLRLVKRRDDTAVGNLCKGDEIFFFKQRRTSSEQISARHEKLLDCVDEFSDQNFVDESNKQMHVTTMSKRSKAIVPEVSSKNQILTVEKSHVRL